MTSFPTRLIKKLEERLEAGNLRKLSVRDQGIDFYSNDYLGLSSYETTAQTSAYSFSPGSSRLIAGTTNEHLSLERKFAQQFTHEAALLFISGYSANCGLFSAIGLKDTVFVYDEFIHASIKDGLRLSFSKSFSFKHNDLADAERLLKKFKGQHVFIVVESLYSMHGDFAPLKEIARLAQQYGVDWIVDEAHTGGLFGKGGYCEYLSIEPLPIARIVTFGKAYGSSGACVLSSQLVIDYLINFSRPFIYTTALSLNHVKELEEKVIHSDLSQRQQQLQENISYFRAQFKQNGMISAPTSPIQTLHIGDALAAKLSEQECEKNGIHIKAILAPTVPKGAESLRISIHSFNTRKEIDQLLQFL